MSDAEVAELAFQQRRAQNNSDFLPHYLQRVATISCVLRSGDALKVWSLSEPEQGEGEIIQRFFDGVEKFTPAGLVERWRLRPAGAALPRPRAWRDRPRYWDMGDGDYGDSRDFKWNNYISRYHAPSRPDGPAGDVPATCQCAAR